LQEVADAYPDPKTGRNTAVSIAVEAEFIGVNVMHRPELVEARRIPPGPQKLSSLGTGSATPALTPGTTR
jgi:hypothetical protein